MTRRVGPIAAATLTKREGSGGNASSSPSGWVVICTLARRSPSSGRTRPTKALTAGLRVACRSLRRLSRISGPRSPAPTWSAGSRYSISRATTFGSSRAWSTPSMPSTSGPFGPTASTPRTSGRMTPGFDPDRYGNLLLEHRPRVIADEEDFAAAQEDLDGLLALDERSPEQDALLDLLTTLIEDWERREVEMPELPARAVIRFLSRQPRIASTRPGGHLPNGIHRLRGSGRSTTTPDKPHPRPSGVLCVLARHVLWRPREPTSARRRRAAGRSGLTDRVPEDDAPQSPTISTTQNPCCGHGRSASFGGREEATAQHAQRDDPFPVSVVVGGLFADEIAAPVAHTEAIHDAPSIGDPISCNVDHLVDIVAGLDPSAEHLLDQVLGGGGFPRASGDEPTEVHLRVEQGGDAIPVLRQEGASESLSRRRLGDQHAISQY